MASFSSTPKLVSICGALLVFFSLYLSPSFADTFDKETEMIWGSDNAKQNDDGTQLSLSLDTNSGGSGFKSKDAYLFGRIDIQIKLVQGNSAGTVSTFYISSEGAEHDEVDFEFLGNLSGQPYIVHTNLFAHGLGEREQQFYLWFDPTADFHNYTFLWNPQHLAFLVDDIPIRDYKNHEDKGLFFPNSQPMNVYGSIWNGEGWATMGGRVKTDWSQAPFTVHYQNFNPQACVPQNASMVCSLPDDSDYTWFDKMLDEMEQQKMKWVHTNFKLYDYCTDVKRWPDRVPLECTLG